MGIQRLEQVASGAGNALQVLLVFFLKISFATIRQIYLQISNTGTMSQIQCGRRREHFSRFGILGRTKQMDSKSLVFAGTKNIKTCLPYHMDRVS